MLWRIGKALIGCCSCSCSPFSKPGKSELLFHHRGGEGRGEMKGGWRERRDGAAVRPGARCCSSSWQPAQHVHSPDWKTKGLQPRSTGKSVRTAQMCWGMDAWPWGESTRGSEASRGRGDEAEGKRMRSRVMGTPPHTSALLCYETHSQALSSLHSPLFLVGGVNIFSIFSLPLFQLAGFVLNCTGAAQSQALCLTPLATLLCII